jgi:tetratricopeptide (TPR) repeat protein
MEPSDSLRMLADAKRHLEAGQPAEAEHICREILAGDSDNPDALNLLAAILCHRNAYLDAVPLLATLLTREPHDPVALRTLGRALRATGQPAAGLDILARATAARPFDPEIWSELGLCLFAVPRLAEAADALKHAVALRPDGLDDCCLLGAALTELGQLDEAAAVYRSALLYHPRAARLHGGLGAALIAQGRFDDGIKAYGEAVVHDPDQAATWLAEANHRMATVLRKRGQLDAAAAALQQAIALKPNCATAHADLGLIFKELGRLDDAIASYRQAIAIDPRHAVAHINLGVALHRRGEAEAALAALETAAALAPGHANVYGNMANVLQTLGRIAESRQMHEQAVAIEPANAKARHNRALSILLSGDLKLGFAEYEWRRKGGSPDHAARGFSQPEWDGGPLAGRTILLHSEQGLGDTLQFVRFVSAVEAMGARVVLQVQPPLVSLLQRSFPAAEVIARTEPPPPFDVQLPLMSLPWRLGTTLDTIPANIPYLTADPAKVAVWRERLAGRGGLKVGLVWSGNPKTKHDRQRSIAAKALLDRLPSEGVALFSLQKDVRPQDQPALAAYGERIVDLASSFADFSDTAAAVSALDLVITVDSAVAHLAGGLGRPAWMLTPYALDWRWLCERTDSPWYPTLRLFRQARPGEWAGALAEVGEALRSLGGSGGAIASAA